MDKKKAAKKMRRIRTLYKIFMRKRTAADVRHVDTSYGKIRVLEYGLGSDDIKPLYVDIHGGGYCIGSPEMDEEINLLIAERANVKVISIDYPKAPEHPYPVGQEATYEVIKHYHNNAVEYRIDKENIGIGGYSSGGNFATSISMKAKERGDFRMNYQMMCFPGTDIRTSPYDKQGSNKVLKRKFLEAIHACYLSDPDHASHPYTSPRWASKDVLTGLPPALLILAGIDPLYLEGKEYGERLKEAGVDVETHVFEGADHGFTLRKKSDDKTKAYNFIINFVKRHAHP